MKFTDKQLNELKIIEWFIPDTDFSVDKNNGDSEIGISDIEERTDGMPAEEAFFMKSQFGKFPTNVENKPRLRALLWGKKWRERHLREIWNISLTLPQDFEDEPEYIQEFVFTKFFGHPKGWRPKYE